MRWEDLPESQNVEDRRGEAGGGGGGGFGGGFPGGAGGLSIGTVLILGMIGYATGIDPSAADRRRRSVLAAAAARRAGTAEKNRRTDDRRERAIRQPHPRLDRINLEGHLREVGPDLSCAGAGALFAARPAPIAAASAMAAMGPFYCPADKKIYLDTSFFQMIETALPRLRRRQPVLPLCAGLCDRARGRRITCRTSSAFSATRNGSSSAWAAGRRRPTASRCASSCRPIASPASGPTARRSGSRPATSRRRCAPRARSATIRCSADRRATWCRTRSPTARSEQRQRWFYTGFKQGTVDSCNTFSPTAQL